MPVPEIVVKTLSRFNLFPISSLLTRFYVPQEGQIRLDDMPLNDVDLKALRAQFAVVSQNVTLFNDTIANNIAYGAEGSSRETIEQVARLACVSDFTQNMPNGLNTLFISFGYDSGVVQ